MTASYLHGVETIDVTIGPRSITGVKTAVIALIGTAPLWQIAAGDQKINTPTLITSAQDAARYFGTVVAGYTIPQALKAIFDQGKGIVIVVNVFNPATHKTSVALATHTFGADDTIALADQGVRTVVVKDSTAVTTYVLTTDYTVNAVTGVVTRVSAGAIAAGATVKIGYDKPDTTTVTNDQVTGTIDGSGNRTGLQALDDCYNLFGFWPKLLIAPAFGTLATVSAAIEVKATALRAFGLIDAPIGTTVAVALAGRGPDGVINFQTSSKRMVLCYPYVSIDDGNGGTVLDPLSSRVAGVIAARDVNLGYHWSPSNAAILGIVGIERRLSAMINDPNSDVNTLNAAGIMTVFSSFGTGFLTWGNRSAAFPTDTAPENFIAVQRVADILHESIELSMLQFIDQPINSAVIDSIKDSVNGFIRTLIGRGALVDGSCTYDPADNDPTDVAAGHLTFSLDFMPPVPMERVSFKSFIDTTLLSALGSQSNG